LKAPPAAGGASMVRVSHAPSNCRVISSWLWGGSWSGFGKRFASREAQMTISNALEAGIGAAWGEDPRYLRSGRAGVWSRTGYAAKTVFVAHRRDGRLAPAWARYVGGIGGNLVANTWLPPSSTTASHSVRRIGNGYLGRFVSNLWTEFWPDVRNRFTKRESTANATARQR
jgi:hypothetical protein